MAKTVKKKAAEISFEDALASLKEASDTLRLPNLSLDAAMEAYEDGIEYYRICEDILSAAKQKIEKIEA